VLGSARTARAGLDADRAFDHLHVAIPPLLKAFVEVDQAFTNLAHQLVLSIDRQQDVLHRRRRLDWPRDVSTQGFCRYVEALAREVLQEVVPHGGRVKTFRQGRSLGGLFGIVLEGRHSLVPERKLELAKLDRLETARLVEPSAK